MWIPLDLSNLASFNVIIAHAAAYLSKIQKTESDRDTLILISEAIYLIRKWLSDLTTLFEDKLFTAV